MQKSATAFLACLLTVSGVAQTNSLTSSDSEPSLGEIARQTRQQVAARDAAAASKLGPARQVIELTPPSEVNGNVIELLMNRKFGELEALAEQARSRRSRLPGGKWQLYDFYEIISKPAGKDNSTTPQWNSWVALLKSWSAEIPSSYTARIALAEAELNWGWQERGHGFSDTVSDGSWKSFDAHARAAMSAIKDPVVMNSNDPFRYAVLLQLGLIAPLSKPQMKTLFERALSEEPDFYHFYRLYANYLQEKWYGAPGEALAFAEASANRLGAEQGDFVYFELANLFGCDCGDGSQLKLMSWTRIKSGYAAMERLYGVSMLKRNRMAFMASKMNDVEVETRLFQEIGESWEPEVWHTAANYQRARTDALGSAHLGQ